MRFQFPNGQVIMLDAPFSYEGVNYPANWLRGMSVQQRADWGLVEIEDPEPPVTPAPPVVPPTITPLQARKALRAAGLKQQVDALLAQAPEEVKEEWEYATQIERNHPTLLMLATQLGMSSQQLDTLFIDAAGR